MDVAGDVSTSAVHSLVAELWKQIVRSVGITDTWLLVCVCVWGGGLIVLKKAIPHS